MIRENSDIKVGAFGDAVANATQNSNGNNTKAIPKSSERHLSNSSIHSEQKENKFLPKTNSGISPNNGERRAISRIIEGSF